MCLKYEIFFRVDGNKSLLNEACGVYGFFIADGDEES
jgi:hypothetical protein